MEETSELSHEKLSLGGRQVHLRYRLGVLQLQLMHPLSMYMFIFHVHVAGALTSFSFLQDKCNLQQKCLHASNGIKLSKPLNSCILHLTIFFIFYCLFYQITEIVLRITQVTVLFKSFNSSHHS